MIKLFLLVIFGAAFWYWRGSKDRRKGIRKVEEELSEVILKGKELQLKQEVSKQQNLNEENTTKKEK